VTGTYIGVGDSAYVFSFFEDISERHAIESALRETKKSLERFIEQAGDAFFLFGAGGNVLDANRQAESYSLHAPGITQVFVPAIRVSARMKALRSPIGRK